MSRYTRIVLNPSALKNNLDTIKVAAGKSNIMAVVKANAYGHGGVWVSSVLDKADALAVCSLGEALELKAANINKPVVLLEGFFYKKELGTIADNNFIIVLHNERQLNELLKGQPNKPLKTIIKINTGMNRLGFGVDDFGEVLEKVESCSNLEIFALMTHFANADSPKHFLNLSQLSSFAEVTSDLSYAKSCANSAAVFAIPESHYDWVRPGIALYGSSPLNNKTAHELNLQAVMNFEAEIIDVKFLSKGEHVGYGSTWTAPRDSFVATIGAGYGDGYPRHAPNGTPVWIDGRFYEISGRVSMDMFSVNLGSNHASVKVGDVAQLWGDKLPADIIAQHADTISYELFCNISSRVKRIYKDT